MFRSFFVLVLGCLGACWLTLSCVDPEELTLRGSVDILVVDGTITNLAEPQIVKLDHSQADRLTGRFGTTPVTEATVEVVVDSTERINLHETDAGQYQAPDGFIGKVGHSYQVRFTLSTGTHYESTVEVMKAVPAIDKIYAQFNPTSLLLTQRLDGSYAAAHEFYVDFKDPSDQTNYYRWDWIDWEQQEWCHTCSNGIYQIYNTDSTLLEDCVSFHIGTYYIFDYNCRTACWEIIYSNELTLFNDQYSNGGSISRKQVAQVPLYSKEHALVEIRQSSLTQTAYAYFKQLADQTQNTGGLADTPPSAPVGNVHNVANRTEGVVGYFTASAVSSQRYWLDRRDATGTTPGLFKALNGRDPSPEGMIPGGRYRPPLAVCVQSDTRTPVKPIGWQD